MVFPSARQADEKGAEWWQTERISQTPGAGIRIAYLVAIIQKHFIGLASWKRTVNDGSVTLQNEIDSRQVLTVFIDKGNKLADEYGLQGLSPDPIVVAIELTHLPLYVRGLVRQDLWRFPLYMDPEAGYAKRYLAPNPEHHFDILFLDDAMDVFRDVTDEIKRVCGSI